MDEDPLEELILMMRAYMARWPTEDEVIQFVFGTDEERAAILHAS